MIRQIGHLNNITSGHTTNDVGLVKVYENGGSWNQLGADIEGQSSNDRSGGSLSQ